MFDAVTKALDSHSEETMVGACLWASQGAASSAGNLPGPNSLYVGAVRFKALRALGRLANKAQAPQAVLDDVLPHAFDALKLNANERTAFGDALKKFRDKHVEIRDLKDPSRIKLAQKEANNIYNDELAAIVKDKGRPQSGPLLTGGMTVVNLVCLILVWELTPELKNFSARNVADVALASVNVGAGICTTLLRMRVATDVMTKLIENPYVGPALGYLAVGVNMIEGAVTFFDEYMKQKSDRWVLVSGGLQFGSGALILIGILGASPGFQLAGVIVGLVASAVAIGEDVLTDKMVRFITQLIKQIKEANSTYDNAALMISVGVQKLVIELEALVSSCDVTTLAFNRNWTGPGGAIVSKDIVHDQLNALGIDSAQQRDDLVRAVWAE